MVVPPTCGFGQTSDLATTDMMHIDPLSSQVSGTTIAVPGGKPSL